MSQTSIIFRVLRPSDVSIVYQWFNLPHVQAFYSLRSWTESEVSEKVSPYFDGTNGVQGYIAEKEGQPFGYAQVYAVKNFPWENQDLPKDVLETVAGMDLFIGDPLALGQGLGQKMIESFLNQIVWKKFNFAIVDPDSHNTASIRCFEKSGFKLHKIIDSKTALGKSCQLQLMIKKRN